MSYDVDALRYHRLDQQHQSEGFTPEEIRDLTELDLFDGQVHRLYDDDMPVALGLLCEDMPTAAEARSARIMRRIRQLPPISEYVPPSAAEDAAFAGETGDPPELCRRCGLPIVGDDADDWHFSGVHRECVINANHEWIEPLSMTAPCDCGSGLPYVDCNYSGPCYFDKRVTP